MGSGERTFAIAALMGVVGLVFAIIEQLMYTQGILINNIVTTELTLRTVQFVTILVWQICGVMIAASR